LWIAHEKGLISFNGKKGTEYVSSPGFNGKRAILVSAARGATAVVTDRAVLKGYYFNRQYVFEDLNFPKKFFNPSSFLTLYSGNSGIWIGTNAGLYFLENTKNSSWQRFTTNQGLPASKIYAVTEDSSNRVWACGYDIFGGGTGLYHKGIWTRPLKHFENRPQRPVAAAEYNNILWICSEKGISRFDGYNISNYGPDEGLEGKNMSALTAGPDFTAARFSDKIVSLINILDFNRN
jgi:ligand-binding sensor domain-containing protein